MRPFREFMAKIRQGELDDDLTAALAKLVLAVQTTDKAGALTLKIHIRPTKGLAVEIEDEISLKLPELAKPATLLFPTIEGNLQENNPMQKSLDLTSVSNPAKELHTVAHQPAVPLATVGGAT